MHVANQAIEQILRNADPQSRAVMASILTGKVIANVYCLSDDIFENQERNVTDAEGNLVYYKVGDKKGEPKKETVKVKTREGCKGRMIGRIYDTGQVDPFGNAITRAEPIKDEDGNYWLRSTRKRLDGVMGCECWCGNDSRIAVQEAGHIDFSGNPPTKAGLEAIIGNVQKNPTVLTIKNGRTEADGFAYEGVN